ncbi:13625_t:CDS:10 [Acaulospora colombiana]|uniref:13625_t:CDS:1 n=1 Tax=Acaulospora colombiana TaxID=27376 RepID=A0ACA9LBC9_9GLOM|nr:13625_t:CDS:10 [Acaulospora colombiana]
MERPPLSPTRDLEQSHSGSANFPQPRPLIGSTHPMPPLHMAPAFRPLLPSGWTEHQAPNGMFYYYNAATGQSSWERPVMTPGFATLPVLHQSVSQQVPAQQQKEQSKVKKKKEKAKSKKPIPDTKWHIVTTTEGNQFYYNSETKQSLWKVPEEIAEAVRIIKEQEARESQNQKSQDKTGVKRKAEDDDEAMAGEDAKRAKGGSAVMENEGTELTEDDIAFQLQFMEEQERQESDVEHSESHDHSTEHAMSDEGSQLLSKEKGKGVDLLPEERALKFKVLSEKDEYLKLLEEETSYRSHWDSFRSSFKRDPRFKNFADDKEREKLFRKHVRDLKDKEAERKRAQQKKAVEDFMKLLRETREIQSDSSWRKVKRLIDDDPRYEAVQSSSQREELFREYCKKLEDEDVEEMERKEHARKQRERKEREEESLRNREAQVRNERRIQNFDRNSTKKRMMREESIREFQTLLIDLVRTHETTWESKKTDLSRDHRFGGEGLDDVDRERLFNEHIDNIYRARLKSYHQLLEQHVKLDTTWLEVYPVIKDDPRAVRLSKDEFQLENLFNDYVNMRVERVKQEFLELLKENQFVEYRARMVQLSENGAKDETGAEKEKARKLTLEEIHDVLKDDTRFLVLNIMPEVRDELITQYLNNMEAPKMTVHQGRE